MINFNISVKACNCKTPIIQIQSSSELLDMMVNTDKSPGYTCYIPHDRHNQFLFTEFLSFQIIL